MHKQLFVLSVLLLICGCAALTPEEAVNMPTSELCKKMLLSSKTQTRRVAEGALLERGDWDKCDHSSESIVQEHHANEKKWLDMLAVGLRMMAAQPPAPVVPPPPAAPVVCQTRNRGYGNMETICQ
jgi:hypothetical protein